MISTGFNNMGYNTVHVHYFDMGFLIIKYNIQYCYQAEDI